LNVNLLHKEILAFNINRLDISPIIGTILVYIDCLVCWVYF